MKLIGVGVGPGDPELVTVKAVRLLREADAVLVPVLDTGEGPGIGDQKRATGQAEVRDIAQTRGRAEATVRAYVDAGRVRRVPFALNERDGLTDRRTAAWERAAATVRECFGEGVSTVAFATIGDPNVYSTFTYLARTARRLLPGLQVETTPGIIAMQDLAARSGTVLVEGTETLTLIPMTGSTARLRDALDSGDTVVAYKCGSRMPDVLDALDEAGRIDHAAYGSMLGLDGEDVRPVGELHRGEPATYLSTVIAPPERARGGGMLL